MADLVTDPTVYANQLAIAGDVRAAEANIRDKVGAEACLTNKNIGDTGHRLEKSLGDNRYTIASEAAAIRQEIGAEACAINKHIGDARQEDAENFGNTRRDVMAAEANIRRDTAQGFAETRYNVAENAGDIRREQQAGFGDIRFNVAERAGDIRRELAQDTGLVQRDVAKAATDGIAATKDARYETVARIEANADRLENDINGTHQDTLNRFFTVGRDTMDLRAQVTALGVTVRDNAQLSALQTEKAVLANTIEGQRNTQYLADKIVNDGEKTRALINDLKYHDLNRGLVERNTELVNCEQDRRFLRDRWEDARWGQFQAGYQGQFAQLQSQIQAFNSQLQDTRQSMVNFGTMAGVGQANTANSVR